MFADMAIVGLACRYPGAKNIVEFWRNLHGGIESIVFLDDEMLQKSGVTVGELDDSRYVKARGFLEDIRLFDASFFGYSKRDAEVMDPQHRFMLECAWEALENAGYNIETYGGRVGLYSSANEPTYFANNIASNDSIMKALGKFHARMLNSGDFISTQVSYKLNLRGPSLNVQTACSSSLVAVYLACQDLLNNQCDMALAGGVNISIPQERGYRYQEGGVLSPDGHCRAFDASAQGCVGGCGIGVVVLKRLKDAIKDGDHIWALIKGIAANNDGAARLAYTAPSVRGQYEVIAEAMRSAGIEAETVGYIEAHGTGTPLGDPIEVEALTRAFRLSTSRTGYCAIRSVKTNIGHLDNASGIAGLITAVLSLKNKKILASLNYEQANPRLCLEKSPFYVPKVLSEWCIQEAPRRAGVSSFGMGGTNVHAILEEAPTLAPPPCVRPWHLVPLSAKTDSALEAMTNNLVAHLKENLDASIANVAFTLTVGRKAFGHRSVAIVKDVADAAGVLAEDDSDRKLTDACGDIKKSVTLILPQVVSGGVGMAQELYAVEPEFRKQICNCATAVDTLLEGNSKKAIHPSIECVRGNKQGADPSVEYLMKVSVHYALARLWMWYGVKPKEIIGYGSSEYVAACLAGVLAAEDALLLFDLRNKLMDAYPRTSMLVVPLPSFDVGEMLNTRVHLAGNSIPNMSLLSGPCDDLEMIARQLASEGVMCRYVPSSHAIPEGVIQATVATVLEKIKHIKLQPPRIPYMSNMTGVWATDAEAVDTQYWARHLCQALYSAVGREYCSGVPHKIVLIAGPDQGNLWGGTEQAEACQYVPLPTLAHSSRSNSDLACFLTTMGKLWLSGIPVDLTKLYRHEKRHRICLPTYPFERERFWIEPERRLRDATEIKSQDAKRVNEDWLYAPSWARLPAPCHEVQNIGGASKPCWLLFLDACGVGEELVAQLEQKIPDVIVVRMGAAYSECDDGSFLINPEQRRDFGKLCQRLRARGLMPNKVVFLWSLSNDTMSSLDSERLDICLRAGFYGLLYLVQACDEHEIARGLRIVAVSNGIHEVTGGETLRPEQAPIVGLVRVIRQEYPYISCSNIDIDILVEGATPSRRLVQRLMTELGEDREDPVIAIRGDHSWRQDYNKLVSRNTTHREGVIRKHGVYVITGGLGSIGLVLAEHLAQVASAKLILIGRSPFPARDEWGSWLARYGADSQMGKAINRIKAMEELGAEIMIAHADVSDRHEMKRVIAEGVNRYGRINGVIHAAGDTRPDSFVAIMEATRVDCEKHFKPKIYGLLVLNEILRTHELDFCLLMSSLSSLLGGIGFAAYSAANCFMDAFSNQEVGMPRIPWISVNWDSWEFKDGRERHRPGVGHEARITPTEGARLIPRILSIAKAKQVIVSTEDLHLRGDCRRYSESSQNDTAPHNPVQKSIESLAGTEATLPALTSKNRVREVERVLGSCTGVRECVVLDLRENSQGTGVVAFVVCQALISTLSFRRDLRTQLPSDMIPSHFVQLDAIPRTIGGETDYSHLCALANSRLFQEEDKQLHRGGVQNRIAEIWQDVLGIEAVKPSDNFLDIGGSSVLAIQVASLMEAELGVRMPLVALFNQTLEQCVSECEIRLRQEASDADFHVQD